MKQLGVRSFVAIAAAALLCSVAVRGQQFENNFKFNSGQDVQPIFEGWSRNADGSATMHFGYLNRNWVERPMIGVGPGNSIEPGGPDQGQPTFFYPRTNRNIFTVKVPKDWGKKELIWTLTVNGKTQKAYGWLQPEWEIDPAGGAGTGGRTDDEYKKNKAPALQLDSPSNVAVGQSVTLIAKVTDDGLPKPTPPKKAAIGQETPPLLQGSSDAPVNLPELAIPGRGAAPPGRGPIVTWTLWRGPSAVEFAPRTAPVEGGKAQTVASFPLPGEYVLRVSASDRLLSTQQDLRVTVQGGPASSRP